MQFATASLLAFAATASAVTIPIAVGPGLAYTPEQINAEIGDVLEFSFSAKNHTVTQSSFKEPCKPIAGGFFSGFVPTAAGVVNPSKFAITVTSKAPIWFYCSQVAGKHCQNGMVGSVNAAKEGANTFDAYKAAAFALLSQNLTGTAPTTGPSTNIFVPPTTGGNGTAPPVVSGGSTTVIATQLTSTYEVKTSVPVAYTTNGVVTSSFVATTYQTTAVVSATITSVSGGVTGTPGAGGAGPAPTTTKPQSGAAATGVPGGFFAAGAVVLGALAMV